MIFLKLLSLYGVSVNAGVRVPIPAIGSYGSLQLIIDSSVRSRQPLLERSFN